jgi:tRNA (cytidine/uridine-2'-O-)-methyltransferase
MMLWPTPTRTGGYLRLALFEPDIPQNTGALLRLAACLGVEVDLIEPCGFLLDDRRVRRAALDYSAKLSVRRHARGNPFSPITILGPGWS